MLTITMLPMIFLLSMTCLVLLLGLVTQRFVYMLAQLSLIGVFLLSSPSVAVSLSVIFTGFMFVYARKELSRLQLAQSEFYALCLFSLLGMLVMLSADNWMTLYLAIELMSLPLYTLCAFQRKLASGSESAIKYFVTGAIASGFLLYGISLIYGATGSFDFSSIAVQPHFLLLVGMVFILAGFAFKLGLVPFHMWAPDVYEGAPTYSVLFLATIPKLATVALLARLFYFSFSDFHLEWMQLMNLLAVLSIFLGNVVALRQNNIKRLFAYSSIAHMGYAFLALSAGTSFGLSSAMFYIATYIITAIGGIAVLAVLNKQGLEFQTFNDLAGLNATHPWLAFMMLLFVFSMAGIPPTVGFVAKLGVLMALVKTHQVYMAVYLVLMAVVSVYYYLRIIKVMYFEKAEVEARYSLASFPTDVVIAISLNGVAVFVLGIFPNGLLRLV